MTTPSKLKIPNNRSKSTSGTNKYVLFFVKILFVLLILLLLPKFVISKKPKNTNRRRRKVYQIYQMLQNDCETHPKKCGSLIPEESMNCVMNCMSPSCYESIFSKDPLELGEVDFEREKEFGSCIRKELHSQERKKNLVKKKP